MISALLSPICPPNVSTYLLHSTRGERGQGGPPFHCGEMLLLSLGALSALPVTFHPPNISLSSCILPVSSSKVRVCIYTTCIFTLLLLCSTDTAASACLKRHATGYDFNALHPAAESVDEDLSDFCVFVVSFVSPISLSVGMNGCAKDMIKDTIYAPPSPRCGKVHDPSSSSSSSLIYPYASSFPPPSILAIFLKKNKKQTWPTTWRVR